MKPFHYLYLLLILLSPFMSNAQKIETYHAWVNLIDGNKIKGILHSADEKGVTILDKNLRDTTFVASRRIDKIKVRRKGSIGRGAWIGALSGAVVGGIIGYERIVYGKEPDEYTVQPDWLFGALTGAYWGSVAGMLVGLIPRKYSIRGNPETYIINLPKITQYALYRNIPISD